MYSYCTVYVKVTLENERKRKLVNLSKFINLYRPSVDEKYKKKILEYF